MALKQSTNMTTQSTLLNVLAIVGRNLSIPTSKQQAINEGKDTYLFLDKHSGRYSIREAYTNEPGQSYAFGMSSYAYTAKQMYDYLAQLSMFTTYLKNNAKL